MSATPETLQLDMAPVRRWTAAPAAVRATMRRMLPTAARRETASLLHFPTRYSFLDNAYLSREMDRL